MTKKRALVPRPRRSREEWLEAALAILSSRCGTRIRVRDLCEELGVTTGSFYRHFSGREEFVSSGVRYWQHRSTTQFIERLRESVADPKARLIELTTGLIEEELARYDVPVRTWATQEPGVAALVRRADQEHVDAHPTHKASARTQVQALEVAAGQPPRDRRNEQQDAHPFHARLT